MQSTSSFILLSSLLLSPGLSLAQTSESSESAPNTKPAEEEASAKDTPSEAEDRLVSSDEVIIVYDRVVEGEDAAAYSNLTRQTLEEEGAFKDIPTLLSELPSIMWFSENGNGIGYNYLTIRGFDQRRVSVMVDGVPQNDPEDHNVYWVNFYDLGGSLEDVQVQRGGAGTAYGPPAIGGTVNLLTRRFSDDAYGSVEAGVGLFDPLKYDGTLLNAKRFTAEANSGLIGDRFVFYGRASYLTSEGYRDWSWAKFKRGFLGLEYRGDRSTLRLQAYGGPQDDALAYYGIPKCYNDPEAYAACEGSAYEDAEVEPRRLNWSAGTDIEHFSQSHYDLIHTFNPNEKVALQNTLFYLRGVGYFDFAGWWGTPDYYRFDEALPEELADPYYDGTASIPDDTLVRAYVGNHQIGWLPRLTLAHTDGEFIVGGEFRFHRSEHWGRIQDGSFSSLEASYLVGEEANHHFYAYRGGKDVASLYVAERYARNDFVVNAALQGIAQRYLFGDEAYAGHEFTVPYLFLNPRLGVNYRVNHRVGVYASVSKTTREPRFKNLYEADEASWGVAPAFEVDESGNLDYSKPLVEPETLIDYELGMGYEASNLRFKAGLYYMDFFNEIVPSGGVDIYGQPYTDNAARTYHAGLELEGAMQLTEHLDLAANYTESRNRFREYEEYCEQGDALVAIDRSGNTVAGFPDRMGNARLTYRNGGARFALAGKYIGAQYTDNSNNSACGNTPLDDDEGIVDPYFLMGLSAGYHFKDASPLKGLSVSLDVNNLLNDYILLAGYEGDFFPMATRNYYLRAKYTF